MDTPGMVLHTPEGRPHHFDPGALCLELLTTGGPGAFARYEVLGEPAGLYDWVAASRLPGGLDLTVAEADLAAVREVRNALFRMTADRAHARDLDPADLAAVNEAAAKAPLVARVAADGSWQWAPGATVEQLLSTVARDAVDLFTGPYARRIRECGAHDCFLLFVDTSRPGRRRWCAMERCGNRSKVRTHRARRADSDSDTGTGTEFGERRSPMNSKPVGLTQDAGWEIGVSRTLPLPPSAVWDFIASPEGVALWLGEGVELPTATGESYRTADGVSGEIRSYRPGDRIRLTYGTTVVQVAVSAGRSASGERAVLRFHQEHLANADERERRRAHWQAVAAEVKEALGVV